MTHLISLILISLTLYFSTQNELNSVISLNSNETQHEDNPNYSNLREWLGQLIIDIPNELIEKETSGFLKDLTLYGISLDKIITTSPQIIENKVGVTLSVENARVNIKGVYNGLIVGQKKFVGYISKLNIKLPFFLVKDKENGLVSEVDTSGFNIDLDNVDIKLDIDLGDLIAPLLKIVLRLIKTNLIEKKFNSDNEYKNWRTFSKSK